MLILKPESTLDHLQQVFLLAVSHLLCVSYLNDAFIEVVLDVGQRDNEAVFVLNPEKSFLKTFMGNLLGRQKEVPGAR